MPPYTDVVLTFDHLGDALDVGRGRVGVADPDHPSVVVALPRILRTLDMADCQATFFIEGWSLLHHTDAVHSIASAGHEVGLHGWLHEDWAACPTPERERALADSLRVASVIGLEVASFRAPGGYLAEDCPDVLSQAGFSRDSSLRGSEDREFWESGVSGADAPTVSPRNLTGGLVNVPFKWEFVDQWHYKFRPAPIPSADELVDHWLQQISGPEAGEVVVLVLHPFASFVDQSRFEASRRLLEALAADSSVRFRDLASVVSGISTASGDRPNA